MERTETADKSLIAIIKIVCELKRATDLSIYFRRPEILMRIGPGKTPQLNFSLHMGWVIQGAIGSD